MKTLILEIDKQLQADQAEQLQSIVNTTYWASRFLDILIVNIEETNIPKLKSIPHILNIREPEVGEVYSPFDTPLL